LAGIKKQEHADKIICSYFKISDTEYSFSLQENWDNSGFQIGNLEAEIKAILLALDITIDSINYAVSNNINCIITHHPLFFEKIYYAFDGRVGGIYSFFYFGYVSGLCYT